MGKPPDAARLSRRLCLLILNFASMTLLPGPASGTGQYYETTEFAIDVQPIVDFQNQLTAAYGPAAIRSYDNSKVFLYWMGGDGEGFGTRCDSVYAYSNPNAWSGWNNAYSPIPGTPRPNGRILPNETSTQTLINQIGPSYCYGAPWAWTDATAPANLRKYRITSPKAGNDIFDKILYGVGDDNPTSPSNGGLFRWYGLLRTDYNVNGETIHLLRLTWREVTLGTTKYWYGFLGYFTRQNGSLVDYGLTAMRAQLDPSFASDLPITNLQLWVTSGGIGTWANLPLCSAGSEFLFCLPSNASYRPRLIAFGEHPNLHLAKQGASADYHWELWLTQAGSRTKDCGCFNETSNNPAGFGDRLHYRRVDMQQANPEVALQAFPLIYQVQAEAPGSPRCMPGDYDTSRIHGFLLEWTNARVLYSSTNDPHGSIPVCRSDYFGQYLVRTLLKQQ